MKRSPMARSLKPMKRTRVNPKRSKPRRVSVLRDREYLDWLKGRKCTACQAFGKIVTYGPMAAPGSDAIDPAHGPSVGRGMKGPDNGAIPLCRHHHIEQHQIGWPLFEAKYNFSREAEAAAHYAAYLIDTGKVVQS